MPQETNGNLTSEKYPHLAWRVITIAAIVVIVLAVGYFLFVSNSPFSRDTAVITSVGTEDAGDTVTDNISDRQTYRNEEYGFEFQYPENWNVFEREVSGDVSGNQLLIAFDQLDLAMPPEEIDYPSLSKPYGYSASEDFRRETYGGLWIPRMKTYSNCAEVETKNLSTIIKCRELKGGIVFDRWYKIPNNPRVGFFRRDAVLRDENNVYLFLNFGKHETSATGDAWLPEDDMFMSDFFEKLERGEVNDKLNRDMEVFDQILSTFRFIEPETNGSVLETKVVAFYDGSTGLGEIADNCQKIVSDPSLKKEMNV